LLQGVTVVVILTSAFMMPRAISRLREIEDHCARRNEIRARFDERIRSARAETSAGRLLEARMAIDDAEVARELDPTLFSAADLASFDSMLYDARRKLDESGARVEHSLSERPC
jgi:hypothetical protein